MKAYLEGNWKFLFKVDQEERISMPWFLKANFNFTIINLYSILPLKN